MLDVRTEDQIVVLTFNDGKTNAITLDMLNTIRETVSRVNTDDSLKGIVLAAEGRFFSSGFDLPTFLSFKGGYFWPLPSFKMHVTKSAWLHIGIISGSMSMPNQALEPLQRAGKAC